MKIKQMEIEPQTFLKHYHWIFTCTCDNQIIWGAFPDESFWKTRSKQRSWAVRTCKCQTKYELNALTNEVNEAV